MAALPGVERVLDDQTKAEFGLDHPSAQASLSRSRTRTAGSLTIIGWTTPRLPTTPAPSISTASLAMTRWNYSSIRQSAFPSSVSAGVSLNARSASARSWMLFPLDATLVKGSHGRPADDAADGAVLISSDADFLPPGRHAATEVKELVLRHLFHASDRLGGLERPNDERADQHERNC